MQNQGSDNLRELLRVLIRKLGILQKNDASCCGVTIAQCHTLVEIGRKRKISLIELSELLGLDKSTMSRTISNLVGADLVKRETDPENRRYITIELTSKGREVFQMIEDNMHTYYSNIFHSIPETKRKDILESLEILIASINEIY